VGGVGGQISPESWGTWWPTARARQCPMAERGKGGYVDSCDFGKPILPLARRKEQDHLALLIASRRGEGNTVPGKVGEGRGKWEITGISNYGSTRPREGKTLKKRDKGQCHEVAPKLASRKENSASRPTPGWRLRRAARHCARNRIRGGVVPVGGVKHRLWGGKGKEEGKVRRLYLQQFRGKWKSGASCGHRRKATGQRNRKGRRRNATVQASEGLHHQGEERKGRIEGTLEEIYKRETRKSGTPR